MLTPDYIRCGNRVCVVTWFRLIGIVGFVSLWVLLSSGNDGGDSLGPSRINLGGGMLARVVERVGGGMKHKFGAVAPRKALAGLMRSFCTPRSPAGGRIPDTAWLPVRAGEGETADALCDWAATNKAAVPFRTCTYPRAQDTQVSTYIHREGYWNEWRMKLVEDMLPLLDSEDAWHLADGRTLTIDIGSNVGFYALLFAARGYDVISIEPLAGAAVRQLFSFRDAKHAVANDEASGAVAPRQLEPFATLEATQAASWAARDAKAGLKGGAKIAGAAVALSKRVAKALKDSTGGPISGSRGAPVGDGRTRIASAWLYNNGVSDLTEERELGVYDENPGATWVPPETEAKGTGPKIVMVAVDDLLAPASRDPLTTPPAFGASIEPTRVRLIKISAEQMDSRVVSGMRRLLSVGKVPFVIFVFNSAHVQTQGCNSAEMLGALVDHGYRLYHAGIFYSRMEELNRFIKGQTSGQPRSTELVFVGPGAEWA